MEDDKVRRARCQQRIHGGSNLLLATNEMRSLGKGRHVVGFLKLLGIGLDGELSFGEGEGSGRMFALACIENGEACYPGRIMQSRTVLKGTAGAADGLFNAAALQQEVVEGRAEFQGGFVGQFKLHTKGI